ncbi:NAD+ synthase (glutamine-hydrolysing) [Andreprevotia lacus DSM 23236]|jgi:NAD+ synthase/NAD+ synthase (glutamine-hydrolysing)|uniref:Glutamine-dependent NAD(+) synthetase n=1 Tax=Andreprevotia lacus DSM 23236 TaxID=1121001 RepID=A0A1W1X768_9NEIS|nr:NAD+ synthase [Andreprevotia lacus]SMC19598.1 NAD+ synthase (glutamine-hydrolysing) [Andreprevotia lacus DSM 23236]
MSLRIAMAQLNYTLCDFAGNLARIEAALDEAGAADLIVFSELCLSGYYPQDLVEEPDFLDRQQQVLDALLARSARSEAAIVIGAVTRNAGIGKPLHNSLLVLQRGRVVLQYHKQLLPTYNIFDERRHFEPGPAQPALLDLNGVRIGFVICEDAWNNSGADYAIDPVQGVVAAGAQLVVSINASPSNVGKLAQRDALFSGIARHWQVPLLYVNQVGGNDQIVFDGASFAADPLHGIVQRLPLFESVVATLTFEPDGAAAFARNGQPLTKAAPDDLPDSEFYYRQIVQGLRDYAAKVGFTRVVIGSSGGIDSALTVALAADALGAENVVAITMPSQYSSAGSVGDSVTLCANLGVQLLEHPIAELVGGYRGTFERDFGAAPSRLTVENLQARIRGTILMEYSNHFGHLLLTTGNKSEISVGYCTLYGDTNGGLNIIGDLYKTEVFALSRHYNARHGRELIPLAIIEKEPSAELSEGQRDTDSLPPYPVLDEILKLHIEGDRLRPAEYANARDFVAALQRDGQGELVRRILGLVAKSEFKRRQAPPIIRVRNRAFGNGRQMPIAARYGSGV